MLLRKLQSLRPSPEELARLSRQKRVFFFTDISATRPVRQGPSGNSPATRFLQVG